MSLDNLRQCMSPYICLSQHMYRSERYPKGTTMNTHEENTHDAPCDHRAHGARPHHGWGRRHHRPEGHGHAGAFHAERAYERGFAAGFQLGRDTSASEQS